MRNVIAYTASRLLLFAVAFGVLYLLGARGALGLVLAFVISGLASYILLSGQRDVISASLTTWLERRRSLGERLEEGAAKEDAETHPEPDGASAGRASGDGGTETVSEKAREDGSSLRERG